MSDFYQWQGERLILNCHLQPKASRDEFAGTHGDALKIRITAPPVDGKANTYLVKWLAKQFGVPRCQVIILSGASARQKRIAIESPQDMPVELGISISS